ncbi:MAG: RNA polymerase sigma factor [Pseudomonadota bacterium]
MSPTLAPFRRHPRPHPIVRPSTGADSSAEFMREVMVVLPDISRCARQLVKQAADADDLVQETCRRAIEARATFAPGSSLRAWMMCILRNHHRDRIRHARREVFLGDGIDALPMAVPEDARDWEEFSEQDAALALESLPLVFRATYSLHAIRGLSYLEIAHRLGIPCATVGTRLRRARLRLRRILLARYAERGASPSRRSRAGSEVGECRPGMSS